jgi:hypothetical protein
MFLFSLVFIELVGLCRSSPLEDQMAAVKRFEEIVANRKREANLRKRKGAKKIVDAEN